MIEGFATPEGTTNFAGKSLAHKENFRKIHDLTLSNGVNVIDTAINYRAQKSERTVGKAVSELIDEGKINRSEIFISTKNGYVTNDADIQEDFMAYIMREFGKTGVVKEGDISAQYNCMTIPFLEDQLARSQKNLGLDCIDLMYLHNAVEGQPQMPRDEFIVNLKNVFEFFEKQRKQQNIRFYGLATWECFRVPQENSNFLSLTQVIDLAKQVGGSTHGFRFIQLPYNLQFDQAYMQRNQPVDSNEMSILELAKQNGIGVFTSVPLMQGKLLEWIKNKPEFTHESSAVNALQFIRSTPGVLAPLVGQKSDLHVKENLEVLEIPPFSETEFNTLLKKLTQ